MSKRAFIIRTLSAAAGIILATASTANASPPGGLQHIGAPPTVAAAVFLAADLTGANEVPPADPNGRGSAVLRIQGTQVCFSLRWNNIATLTAGHIHGGPAGVNGPVLSTLTGALPASLRGVVGCVTVEAGLAAALSASPVNFYVNLHNAEYPGGAIRGQLRATGATDLNDLLRGPLAAVMDGDQEVPNGADADGRGVAFVRAQGTQVTFAVSYSGIAPPTAGHIHAGAVGVNGGIVVALFAAAGGLPAALTAVAGVVTAPAAVVRQLNSQPANFYFNLHNAAFPAGVVRGQLFRAA